MSVNTTISAHYNSIAAGQSPAAEIGSLQAHFQHDNFFHLSVAQEVRRRQLKMGFSSKFSGKVFLTDWTLGRAEVRIPGVEVSIIKDTSLAQRYMDGELRNAILITTNNDVIQPGWVDAYTRFFQSAPDTVIVVWNLDNHHWYPLSNFLAAHSDIYFTVHPDYMSLLSRYNRCIFGPIAAGVCQWTRSLLRENIGMITSTPRLDQPLGGHVFYEQFRFRNQVLNTIAQHYPDTVGAQKVGYHEGTPLDRLRQWCSHKAHWMVPVMNDVPMRLFDAMTTGGIAIMPDSLKHMAIVRELAEHIVFYGVSDILAPQAVVAAANRKFDEGGPEKVLARHRLGLEHHHVTSRIEEILNTVFSEFEIPRASATG